MLIASVLGFVLSATLDRRPAGVLRLADPVHVGGVLGLIGLWMRRSMAETEQFEQNKGTAARIKNPLMVTLREHPKAVGQLVGFTLLSTLCYYTFFSALTPFATKSRGADATDVFLALSIATALFVALQYPMGALSDRRGRKPQLLFWSAATAMLIVPLSFLIGPGFWNLLVVFVRRARPLHRDDLDRAGDHERAVPDGAARPGHRRLVQPDRRRSSAGRPRWSCSRCSRPGSRSGSSCTWRSGR